MSDRSSARPSTSLQLEGRPNIEQACAPHFDILMQSGEAVHASLEGRVTRLGITGAWYFTKLWCCSQQHHAHIDFEDLFFVACTGWASRGVANLRCLIFACAAGQCLSAQEPAGISCSITHHLRCRRCARLANKMRSLALQLQLHK